MEENKAESEIEYFTDRLRFGIPEVDSVIEDYQADVYHSDSEEERDFAKDENDTEDRIDKLPVDTLQFIISLLSTREGAATGILSKRWRYLWSKSSFRLEFDDTNLFGCTYPRNIFELKDKERRRQEEHNRGNLNRPRRSKRKGVVETDRARFINLVNHILALRSASRLDRLLVRFPMGTESATHLDRWMKLAAAQQVSTLIFDLDWTYFSHREWKPSKRYTFHVQRFGSSVKHMRLDFCVFNFPPHFQGLRSLAYLELYNCFLTRSDVQNTLSKCPSLKWLSIRICEFPYPTILEFVGPSVPLTHLHISDSKHVKEIRLQGLNLLSCELDVADEKISIQDAPHLIRLMLHTKGNVEILGSFPHLERLLLKHKCSKLNLPDLSALTNIKRMAFSADNNVSNLFEVVCILKTFPLLETMEIDMGDFEKRYSELSELSARVATTPGRPHSNLREVLIRGFESYPELIDLAKYLLKNATVLEKMIILSECRSYLGNGLSFYTEEGKLSETELEEVVSKLLEKEARPSTKFLFEEPE